MNEVKRVVSVVLYLVAWGRGERHDRDIVSWYFCDRRYVSRFLSMVTTENQWNDSVSVKDPYSIEKNKLSIKKKTNKFFSKTYSKRSWCLRRLQEACVVRSFMAIWILRGPIAGPGWDAGWVSLSSWFVSVTSAPSLFLCVLLFLSQHCETLHHTDLLFWNLDCSFLPTLSQIVFIWNLIMIIGTDLQKSPI